MKPKRSSILSLLWIVLWLLSWPAERGFGQGSDTLFLEARHSIPIANMGVDTELAICGTGTVFVTDASRSRIWKIPPGAQTALPVEMKLDHFLHPVSICCDKAGLLWIANPDLHEVPRFNENGIPAGRQAGPDISLG